VLERERITVRIHVESVSTKAACFLRQGQPILHLTMKRRQFLGPVAAGVVGTALARDPAVTPKPPLVRTPLVLMAPRPDGLNAVWAVSRQARGRLEWEAADSAKGWAGADPFGFVPQGDGVLCVRLSGLKPGTTCRVHSHTVAAEDGETVTTGWKTIRSLNPAAAETRFVMWNDTLFSDTGKGVFTDEQVAGAKADRTFEQ